MTRLELQKKNPRLYDQIIAEAVVTERARAVAHIDHAAARGLSVAYTMRAIRSGAPAPSAAAIRPPDGHLGVAHV